MGKVRHTNRSRGGGGVYGLAPGQQRPGARAAPSVDLNGLEANINSLEEGKRLQACELFGDLCKLNNNLPKVMDKITSAKTLSKFVMRLVDHSLRVKCAAFRSLQIVSSVGTEEVCNRLLASGIFRTSLTLACEFIDAAAPNATELLEIKQNALYTVANIISTVPASVQEIMTHKPEFFDLLLSNLSLTNISILNTTLNVLNIFSRNIPDNRLINQFMGMRTVTALQQLMQTLLVGKVSTEGSSVTIVVPSVTVEDQDSWIVIIQCLEILSNLFLNSITSPEIQHQIDVRSLCLLAQQIFALCTRGAPTLPNVIGGIPSAPRTRENDLIEMLSEWLTVTAAKVVSYLQSIIDEPSQQILANQVHGRMLHVATVLCQAELPWHATCAALWRFLLTRLQQGEMTTPANYNAAVAALNQAHPTGLPSSADSVGAVSNTLFVQETDEMLEQEHFGDDDDVDALDAAATSRRSVGTRQQSWIRPLPSTAMTAKLVVTHEGVSTLQVLEKTLTALSDIVQLKSLLAACTTADRKDANTSTVTWAADWASLMSYATFLQEAVQNTTAALDTTSQLAVEGWVPVDEEDVGALKGTVLSQCVTFFDLLNTLLENCVLSTTAPPLPPVDPTTSTFLHEVNGQLHLSDSELKAVVVLLLQWLAVPQLEILLSVVQCIVRFGGEDWMSATSGPVFPAPLLLVLSNGLINRMRSPTAFTTTSSGNNSNSNGNSNGDQGDTNVTYTKQQNLQRSSILLLDACCNALIDLHSSDHTVYHTIFQKLSLGQVLSGIKQGFVDQVRSGIFLLSAEERETVEETCANLDGFFEYKASHF